MKIISLIFRINSICQLFNNFNIHSLMLVIRLQVIFKENNHNTNNIKTFKILLEIS